MTTHGDPALARTTPPEPSTPTQTSASPKRRSRGTPATPRARKPASPPAVAAKPPKPPADTTEAADAAAGDSTEPADVAADPAAPPAVSTPPEARVPEPDGEREPEEREPESDAETTPEPGTAQPGAAEPEAAEPEAAEPEAAEPEAAEPEAAEPGAAEPAPPAVPVDAPPLIHADRLDDAPPPLPAVHNLLATLTRLRTAVAEASFPLPLPDAGPARQLAADLVGQLDDYLLPRLRRLDAPMLVVVGGSTGTGKSTLVNSLVRAPVSPAGVLRPTTRAAVLVCHPADAHWFTETNLLPGLGRTTSSPTDPSTLQVVSAPALPAGLAFLDAPDIDSVVDTNRALAMRLLAAADMWLFVTSAVRYTDAVPWEALQLARDRGTTLALLLDRVPEGAAEEIQRHLDRLLDTHGLGGTPVFVLPESALDGQGLLDEAMTATLRYWFTALADAPAARAAAVRRTAAGAVDALGPAVGRLTGAAAAQVAAAESLAAGARAAYDAARDTIARAVHDGELLRGELLARWHELVASGEAARALAAPTAGARQRAAATAAGRSVEPGTPFLAALAASVTALVCGAAVDAAERAAEAWSGHPAGAHLLDAAPALATCSPDLAERVQRIAGNWQHDLLDMVRIEARSWDNADAYALNATQLLAAVAAVAAPEVPGMTAAALRRLDAVVKDETIRALAERARGELLDRLRDLCEAESARFSSALDAARVDPATGRRLAEVAAEVAAAHRTTPLALPPKKTPLELLLAETETL